MEHVSSTSLTLHGHCGPHLPEREPMHMAGNRVTRKEMLHAPPDFTANQPSPMASKTTVANDRGFSNEERPVLTPQ